MFDSVPIRRGLTAEVEDCPIIVGNTANFGLGVLLDGLDDYRQPVHLVLTKLELEKLSEMVNI